MALSGGGPGGAPRTERAADRSRAEEVLALVFTLTERTRAQFEASVAAFDLSPPQAKALRYLAVVGPAPMRDLALTLQCDASNVTGIVDRLERRGLVERRPEGGDRRIKLLVLTPAGRELSHRLWEQMLDEEIAVAGLSGLEPAEQELFVALLRRIHPSSGAGPGSWCPLRG